jgi:hypothetical protein
MDSEVEALRSAFGEDCVSALEAEVLRLALPACGCEYVGSTRPPTLTLLHVRGAGRAQLVELNSRLRADVAAAAAAAAADEPLLVWAAFHANALAEAAGCTAAAPLPPAGCPVLPAAVGPKITLMWFHHIKAPRKLEALAAWARELGVGGALKPGFPGALLATGREDAVDEYVRRIKGLRWQAACVRAELVGGEHGAGDAGLEVVGEGDMHLLVERAKALGIEAHFREAILKL